MKYKISIEILKEVWVREGETIQEALSQFPLTWQNIKAKAIMNITCGNQKHEHLFNMKVLRRIFSNKIVMAHWAKNLDLLLKGGKTTNIPEKL